MKMGNRRRRTKLGPSEVKSVWQWGGFTGEVERKTQTLRGGQRARVISVTASEGKLKREERSFTRGCSKFLLRLDVRNSHQKSVAQEEACVCVSIKVWVLGSRGWGQRLSRRVCVSINLSVSLTSSTNWFHHQHPGCDFLSVFGESFPSTSFSLPFLLKPKVNSLPIRLGEKRPKSTSCLLSVIMWGWVHSTQASAAPCPQCHHTQNLSYTKFKPGHGTRGEGWGEKEKKV